MAASHAQTLLKPQSGYSPDSTDACLLSLQQAACKSVFTVKHDTKPDMLRPSDCLLAFCKAPRLAFADAPDSCLQQDSSTTEQPTQDDTGSDSWTSDRSGYYLLGAIPLIVGVGSLLNVDHRLTYDDSGIWKRSNQLDLEYGVVLTEIGGGLWFGGQSRIGRTFWQSIDASAFSSLAAQALKYTFSRARPSQSSSPNHWFQGGCCQSFPSGEVTLQASFVTPFILEYHQDHPWVWGLEALPLYDALGRMKTHGHWQTDVLSGWALGTAFGIFAHNEKMPFFLSLMPHGVMVGWHTSF
jgi:undecaprenyl-diphosphatase